MLAFLILIDRLQLMKSCYIAKDRCQFCIFIEKVLIDYCQLPK